MAVFVSPANVSGRLSKFAARWQSRMFVIAGNVLLHVCPRHMDCCSPPPCDVVRQISPVGVGACVGVGVGARVGEPGGVVGYCVGAATGASVGHSLTWWPVHVRQQACRIPCPCVRCEHPPIRLRSEHDAGRTLPLLYLSRKPVCVRGLSVQNLGVGCIDGGC